MIHSVPTKAVSLSSPLPDFTCRLLTSTDHVRARHCSHCQRLYDVSRRRRLSPWLFRRNLRFLQRTRELLDRLSTYVEPLALVDDVNIGLERIDYTNTIEFNDLLASYGWYSGFRAPPTTREELLMSCAPAVICHRRLSTFLTAACPTTVCCDGCHTYDVRSPVLEIIRSRHVPGRPLTTALCDVQSYSDLDSDSLASLYDSAITELLDRQVPTRSATCRRRLSSLWFDDVCRGAKRKVRRLERAARREGPLALHVADCFRVAR